MAAADRTAPGLGDPEACAQLHAACFPQEPWAAEVLAGLAVAPGALAWHRRSGQELAGFLLARWAGDEAEVLTLAVAPGFRRRGVAREMMSVLIEDLRRRGTKLLYLEMAAKNRSAEGLYSSLGFSQVGRRKEYYRDGTDALVLRLAIDDRPAGDG